MRYFLPLLFFVVGCSNDLTPKQVNDCADLATLVQFDQTISDTKECILNKTVDGTQYTYYIPINQIGGALKMLNLKQDMAIAPLLKVCMDQCMAGMPKQVCPGDKSLHTQNCGGYCSDAVHLDELEMKIKPRGGPQKRPRTYGPKPPPPIGPRPGAK